MITKLVTVEEYKEIFTEILLNKTDNVSKISEGSALNAIAFGVAKLAQKVNKDIAIMESHIFPDTAVGSSLDYIANLYGISPRFGAKQSSTYVRLVGDPSTTYVAGTHILKSSTGLEFDFDKNYTIGTHGYTYAKIRSRTTGSTTNVNALTINKITPTPTNHKYVVNEFAAQFGSDRENDDVFRKRIKEGVDLLSKSTLSQIEQVFLKINQNVLRVYYGGIDSYGRTVLQILTENGINLTTSELNDIVLRAEKFFSLTEFRPSNFNGYGVTIQNVSWQPLDVSMRVDIDPSFAVDDVRKDIQIRLNKYIDYRYWKPGGTIEWDNMLDIVKSTDGVRYVNDSFFSPSTDIQTQVLKLPRIRGFQMLDLNGNLIIDLAGVLNQSYYPQDIDFKFQASVLQNI